jgi:HSP20 family protein
MAIARSYYLAGVFHAKPLAARVVHEHAAVFTSWTLLVVQGALAGSGPIALRRPLGVLGFIRSVTRRRGTGSPRWCGRSGRRADQVSHGTKARRLLVCRYWLARRERRISTMSLKNGGIEMANDRSQQQHDQQQSRQASTTATSSASGGTTQTRQGDRERSITTNREQPRHGQASSGMQRRPGSQVSHRGRGDAFDNPLSLMQRMADDMDRLFEQFGFGGLALTPSLGAASLWSPQVDVLRRGDKLVVRADVPGMNKEDLHVDVEDNVLTIRGERREEHEDRDEGVFRSERSYGEFYRAIPLPDGVNADACEATYQNGVLEVTLQAPETDRSTKRIPIR